MNDEHTVSRVCVLLATLINEVRGLRGDLAGRSRAAPRTLGVEDTAALAVILPLLHSLSGGQSFTVHELMRQNAVRDALVRCGLGENSRRLGRLLRRAAGADLEVNGLFIDAVGRERDGTSFCVIAETRETRIARHLTRNLTS